MDKTSLLVSVLVLIASSNGLSQTAVSKIKISETDLKKLFLIQKYNSDPIKYLSQKEKTGEIYISAENELLINLETIQIIEESGSLNMLESGDAQGGVCGRTIK